tara:strand:+ start:1134 stop:1940 length:807 start_codon:yes stop_codon:yes gene_type:complete
MNIARDLYYFLIELSWKKFFFLIFFVFLLINTVFGTLYYLNNHALNLAAPTWWDCFFFSVHTFSTIGYGVVYPVSFIANILVTLEACLGLTSTAIITGIVFAKFSKPKSRIIFSKNILINTINNKRVLTFRVGNSRANDLVDAEMVVTALIDEVTPEGIKIARLKDLKLQRQRTPFFSLSWMLFHEINEDSPLFHLVNENSIDSKLITIITLLIGHDGTFSQTIYAKNTYSPEAVIFNKYFVDVVHKNNKGLNQVDYSQFHHLKEKSV